MVGRKLALSLVAMMGVIALMSGPVFGQEFSGTVTGVVRDARGGGVLGVSVTAIQTESGLTRTVLTDTNGSYRIPALPIGTYAVTAELSGFKLARQPGLTLAVGQVIVVDLTLEVGSVQQQITVTATSPLVNVGTTSTAGVVQSEQIKNLPLEGRSYLDLITLNAGSVPDRSNTTNGGNPSYSIGGSRPDDNRFTLDGMDYVGNDTQRLYTAPQGISGYLLGVDAVQEFNVQSDAYGAELGKRAGAQVTIVTKSGTNHWHGSAFEYFRDSAMDGKNYFDAAGVPSFRRHQFGGSIGTPIRRNKLFVFGNIEAFRQILGVSEFGDVPDLQFRQGLLPDASGQYAPVANLQPLMLGLTQYWPLPTGPEVLENGLPTGIAQYSANPNETTDETYGSIRFDYNISSKDLFSSNITADGGTLSDPNGNFLTKETTDLLPFSAQETHIFSPTLVSVATFGFSKAYSKLASPYVGAAWPANLLFVNGGNSVSGPTITINGSNLISGSSGGLNPVDVNRQIFLASDDLKWSKKTHYLTMGWWFERTDGSQTGETTGNSGQIYYPTLLTFLHDLPSEFEALATQTELNTVYNQVAWYFQDEIKLRSNLTLRLGLRDETSFMPYDKNGHNSNYWHGPDGILLTQPVLSRLFSTNNNLALLQPRVGTVWDPSGTGRMSVRAGAGIYYDLQDNFAQKLIRDPPYNAVVTYLNTPLWSIIPVSSTSPAPPQCTVVGQKNPPCVDYAPSTVDQNLRTPTVYRWTVSLERQLGQDFMVQAAYVGSRSVHLPQATDTNTIAPVSCMDAAGCLAGGVLAASQEDIVPQGTLYTPAGSRPNPLLSSENGIYFIGIGRYNALNISLTKRASHGLTFKASYAWANALDTQSDVTPGGATNEPSLTVHPYNVKLDYGPASYNLTQQLNANFSYQLPFGHGAGGLAKLIGGWQWNGIFSATSGFPITLLAGSNRSGNGETLATVDVVNLNPNFTGKRILGVAGWKKTGQYYDPNAFSLPLAGTYGNETRGEFRGPGFWDLDTSLFKTIPLKGEAQLQFRMEAFNALDHPNFSVPSLTVFSGTAISPTAGEITSTTQTGNGRQIQLALRLDF